MIWAELPLTGNPAEPLAALTLDLDDLEGLAW